MLSRAGETSRLQGEGISSPRPTCFERSHQTCFVSNNVINPYLLIDSKEGHGPRAVNGNNRKENKGAPKWGSKPRGLTEINSRKDPVTVASAEIEALLNPD